MILRWWKKMLEDAYHKGYEEGHSNGYKRGYDSGCGEGYRKALLTKHDRVVHLSQLGLFICTAKDPDEQAACVTEKGVTKC